MRCMYAAAQGRKPGVSLLSDLADFSKSKVPFPRMKKRRVGTSKSLVKKSLWDGGGGGGGGALDCTRLHKIDFYFSIFKNSTPLTHLQEKPLLASNTPENNPCFRDDRVELWWQSVAIVYSRGRKKRKSCNPPNPVRYLCALKACTETKLIHWSTSGWQTSCLFSMGRVSQYWMSPFPVLVLIWDSSFSVDFGFESFGSWSY